MNWYCPCWNSWIAAFRTRSGTQPSMTSTSAGTRRVTERNEWMFRAVQAHKHAASNTRRHQPRHVGSHIMRFRIKGNLPGKPCATSLSEDLLGPRKPSDRSRLFSSDCSVTDPNLICAAGGEAVSMMRRSCTLSLRRCDRPTRGDHPSVTADYRGHITIPEFSGRIARQH